MIKFVLIKNFKSVKEQKVDFSKINVFIGEPNSGKTNVLEALGLLSYDIYDGQSLTSTLRMHRMTDCYFDADYRHQIEVRSEKLSVGIVLETSDTFRAQFFTDFEMDFRGTNFLISNDGNVKGQSKDGPVNGSVKIYEFKKLKEFSASALHYLKPPHGNNLPSLLVSNDEIKKIVSDFFREIGYKLQLRPIENRIDMVKELNHELYSYPYYSISETMQRIIFYRAAIFSNRDSSLIFDEPEAHTFPMYTKLLAESIALDENNQFFISTHSPYLLMSLIEKANLQDLNLFVCKMKNYKTEVHRVNPNHYGDILSQGPDIFFNLDLIPTYDSTS